MVEQKDNYTPEDVAEIARNYLNFYDEIKGVSRAKCNTREGLTKNLIKKIEEIPGNVRAVLDPNDRMMTNVLQLDADLLSEGRHQQ